MAALYVKMNEIEQIADKWLDAWSGGNIAAVCPENGDSELDWDLPNDDPQKCLDVILVVLKKISNESDNRLLGLLAAGPLEELLQMNGEIVVDRVDEYARKDPLFRKLLNGVWDSEVKDSVKKQLLKYRGERW